MSAPAEKLTPDGSPEVPEGFEMIDGELVEKDASGEHGGAQAAITSLLFHSYSRRPGGNYPGGWWFATETLIEFHGSKHRYRPDVAGWRRDRVPVRPTGSPVLILPDWICEVLSPSNIKNDNIKKRRIYHQTKVSHYWIVNWMTETLEVYRWHPDGYLWVMTAGRTERVKAEPFDALETPVGVFFGDDEEG